MGGCLPHGLLFFPLDLAYAGLQDRETFPRTFCDYEACRKMSRSCFPRGTVSAGRDRPGIALPVRRGDREISGKTP